MRFGLAMNRGTLLEPETVRSLQPLQQLASGQRTSYGLGWELKSVILAGTPAQAAGYDGTCWAAAS